MTQLISTALLFLVVLALVPLALRWVRQRTMPSGADAASAARVVSAAAVGPQQRVVTVEVGPQGRRVWLVLGVTAQTVNCLHVFAPDASAGSDGKVLPEA